VIGASGVYPRGQPKIEFIIRYSSLCDEFDVDRDTHMIKPVDFDTLCKKPHPKTDRVGLGWDTRKVGKDVIMFWRKSGYRGWWKGKLIKYDAKTGKHTISWADDSMNWEEDLLCCDKVQEWRFVQEDEDVDAYIESLQAKAPQTAPSLMSGGRMRKQVKAFNPSEDGMNDSNIRQCNKRTKRVDGEHEGEANEGDEAVAKAVEEKEARSTPTVTRSKPKATPSQPKVTRSKSKAAKKVAKPAADDREAVLSELMRQQFMRPNANSSKIDEIVITVNATQGSQESLGFTAEEVMRMAKRLEEDNNVLLLDGDSVYPIVGSGELN